jgi:hypothetical protein
MPGRGQAPPLLYSYGSTSQSMYSNGQSLAVAFPYGILCIIRQQSLAGEGFFTKPQAASKKREAWGIPKTRQELRPWILLPKNLLV